MRAFAPPELLAPDHVGNDFDCGSDAQTTWLRRHGLQASQAGTSKVYVVCRPGTRRVVGFYALAAGSILHQDAPSRLTKGVGLHPLPVIILTRLGVDVEEQGKGLGAGLVADAFLQVASVAERVGVRGLLIHAETEDAAAFYSRISPAIEASPSDPLHLILLMKDLRSAIREAAVLPSAARWTTSSRSAPATGSANPSSPDPACGTLRLDRGPRPRGRGPHRTPGRHDPRR